LAGRADDDLTAKAATYKDAVRVGEGEGDDKATVKTSKAFEAGPSLRFGMTAKPRRRLAGDYPSTRHWRGSG